MVGRMRHRFLSEDVTSFGVSYYGFWQPAYEGTKIFVSASVVLSTEASEVRLDHRYHGRWQCQHTDNDKSYRQSQAFEHFSLRWSESYIR